MIVSGYRIGPFADLRDADLRGADLRDATLHGASLRGADLRKADLRNADLRGANLRDANLRNANLHGAYLRNAYLRNADLRHADLRDVSGMMLLPVQDARGYTFTHAIETASGWRIRAGCRDFSIEEALAHWDSQSYIGNREIADMYVYAVQWLARKLDS